MTYRLVKANRRTEHRPNRKSWNRERAASPTIKRSIGGRDKYETYRRGE